MSQTSGERRYIWKENPCVDAHCPCCQPKSVFSNFMKVVNFILHYTMMLIFIGGTIYVYIEYFDFLNDLQFRISFGYYGLIIAIYVLIQFISSCINVFMNTRVLKRMGNGKYTKPKLGVLISCYQEDPAYLMRCLKNIDLIDYDKNNMVILLVIDGNDEKDNYMVDIFSQTFASYPAESQIVIRKDTTGHEHSDIVIPRCKYICIAQKWGGKRSTMATGFKTLYEHGVDYVLCTDSDTKIKPTGIQEIMFMMDEDREIGGMCGNVGVWNKCETFLTYVTSLRYNIAFGIERAAQSCHGCVECISGPFGVYRMSALNHVLPHWMKQKFLGKYCTFGDDRHLTNRLLEYGYKTKYYSGAGCVTETPAELLRWVNQQIRWSKSYYREWCYNMMWAYKHSFYLTFGLSLTLVFTCLILVTMVRMVFNRNIWDILELLCLIYTTMLIKTLFYCIALRKNVIAMVAYAPIYMFISLPSKIYAILTITKTGWGTSGRLGRVMNYESLIPIICWNSVLLAGVIFSSVYDVEDGFSRDDMIWICSALGYISVFMLPLPIFYIVRRSKRRKSNPNISKGVIKN
jgi:hyaluronan synthase